MVNDSIGGVRLNCLITAWASVVISASAVMSPQQDEATGIVYIVVLYLTSCACNKTRWQCCKSRITITACVRWVLTSRLLKSWRTTRRWKCHLPAATRSHYGIYPVMSATAYGVLCISASSAQTEKDFSSVGRILPQCRWHAKSPKWRHCSRLLNFCVGGSAQDWWAVRNTGHELRCIILMMP